MKLGEVCDNISVTFDKTKQQVVLVNTSDVLNGKVTNHVLVNNKGLKGQFKKTFQKDDILYSEIRPKNKRFAFIDFNANDYVASTKLMVIRANKKVLPQYLYQVLKSEEVINQLQALAESRSGTFPQITFSELAQINVRIPKLDEQKEIANFLKLFDDKIENNKKINHHLEQMALSIFKEEFSKKEVTNKLGDFFPVITGKKDANIAKGGEYPFFSCSQNISYTDNYSFDARAILLAGNGDFNVKIFNGKFEAYQRTYVLIPNNDEHFGYLYYAIKYFLNDITSGHRGSVIKFITKGQIEHFDIFMTSNKEKLFLFNSFVENIANNNKEIDKLSNIRDTLLPKLLSGETSVNQAAK